VTNRQVRRVSGPAADGSSYFILPGPITDGNNNKDDAADDDGTAVNSKSTQQQRQPIPTDRLDKIKVLTDLRPIVKRQKLLDQLTATCICCIPLYRIINSLLMLYWLAVRRPH